jgi:SAM-dependent methyltransferase
MAPAAPHPASYRDPAGFVFRRDGVIYRQINYAGKDAYELLVSSGLYATLTKQHSLISHTEILTAGLVTIEGYKIIQPFQIDNFNYPCEWCFSQLKDAALLTLQIMEASIAKGLILKDASAFNITFTPTGPLFIDTTSFELYDEKKPWQAYRQFCENFLAPLVLAHYRGLQMLSMIKGFPDGIPLPVCARLLPFRSKFKGLTALHIHLQQAVKSGSNNDVGLSFSITKMQRLLRHLKEGITALHPKEKVSAWSNYYAETILKDGYLADKEKTVSTFINTIPAETVLDLGANTGQFSILLQKQGKKVVAADNDLLCIERLYTHCRNNAIPLLPIVQDLMYPTAATGWNLAERAGFPERFKSDLILALALIHHLCVAKNLPFSLLAPTFSDWCQWLLIEFVPPEDEKVRYILSQGKALPPGYSEENFRLQFNRYFTILREDKNAANGRILFLLKSK